MGTKKLPRGGEGVNGRGRTSGGAISLHRRGFPVLLPFQWSILRGRVQTSCDDVFCLGQCRALHEATDGRAYVMGSPPKFVEADMGPTRLFWPQLYRPRGASMGKGFPKPVQPQEQGLGSAVTEKDREIRRPSSQGSGPDLHSLVPEEGQDPIEVFPPLWIHGKRVGLFLDAPCIHLCHEDSKPPKASEFLAGQVDRSQADPEDGSVGGSALG